MNETPVLFRLMQFAKSERKTYIQASIFSFLNKLLDIAPEILIGIAIDVVVSKEKSFLAKFGFIDPWEQIIVLGILTLLIWIFESLFEYLHLISWRGLAQVIQHKLRITTYRHVQNLDLAYFEDKNTGNLVSILNDDVNQLERFLDGGANEFIQTFTAVLGVGLVFFVISWQIALIAFVPIPLIIVGAFYFQRKANPLYARVREKVGHLSTRLSNNISGIVTIKSFTNEEREASLVEIESLDYLDANKKAIKVSSMFIPIIRMAILAGFLATFILGGYKVLQGDLRVGMYGVLVFLTQRLLWPLTRLATLVDLYERAMASSRRILDLLKVPTQIHSGKCKPENIQGEFSLENVSFSYATGSQVLQSLTLLIPPKQTTAFVGSTGSGKSTLVKLLSRFYDPTSGLISLDGKPLSEYDLQALRNRMGLVSQDVFLYQGTVKENLLFAKPNASMDEIIECAKLSEVHDFVMKLPQQYDTVIGERGQKLSGGQRQRLSIARAILKNPDILILDEATSNVDNETEAAIQRSISKISKDRTTIVIAHRLSTIVSADQIFVLEDGQVRQKGTHQELIQEKGLYKALWSVQAGLI